MFMENQQRAREHPILFSGPMVRAILAGQKTQTRRVMNPQPIKSGEHLWIENRGEEVRLDHLLADKVGSCKYLSGDRLWVRETLKADERGMFYPADGQVVPQALVPNDYGDVKETLPSMFMPRRFSRVTLEITDVRVERLQDITEGDIIKEGCPNEILYGTGWFRDLWETINGKKHPWASNPWLWVISFKRIMTADTNGKTSDNTADFVNEQSEATVLTSTQPAASDGDATGG